MERIEEVEGLDPAPALFTRKMSLETGQPQLQRRLSPQPPHRGQLRPGGTVVAASSGNTGAAVAMLAAMRGYKVGPR